MRASKLIPNDMIEVDYIPVNIISKIIRDVALQEKKKPDTEMYNLVHPKPFPFAVLADAL